MEQHELRRPGLHERGWRSLSALATIGAGEVHVSPPSLERVSQRSPKSVDGSRRSKTSMRVPSSLERRIAGW
jgi:hypothetical protein